MKLSALFEIILTWTPAQSIWCICTTESFFFLFFLHKIQLLNKFCKQYHNQIYFWVKLNIQKIKQSNTQTTWRKLCKNIHFIFIPTQNIVQIACKLVIQFRISTLTQKTQTMIPTAPTERWFHRWCDRIRGYAITYEIDINISCHVPHFHHATSNINLNDNEIQQTPRNILNAFPIRFFFFFSFWLVALFFTVTSNLHGKLCTRHNIDLFDWARIFLSLPIVAWQFENSMHDFLIKCGSVFVIDLFQQLHCCYKCYSDSIVPH